MKRAVLLVSHGSRSPKTKEEISVLADILCKRLPQDIIAFAFLEIEHPSIPEGIDQCVFQGAQKVVIALNFLNAGRHVDQDIPAIVYESQKKHPQVKISISKPVGQHPQIPNLFIDLINNA